MRYLVKLSAGLACLCALATASDALAKTRRAAHRQSPHDVVATLYPGRQPIAVTRRNWLDPGPVVPVGSTNRYFVETNYFAYQPVFDNQRSWFDEETLPRRGRFEIPYRDGLVQFWGP